MQHKRVIFVAVGVGEFALREWLLVAMKLREEGLSTAFVSETPLSDSLRKDCEAYGITLELTSSYRLAEREIKNLNPRNLIGLYARFLFHLFGFSKIVNALNNSLQDYGFGWTLARRGDACAFVMHTDTFSSKHRAIALCARKKNIPVFVAPLAAPAMAGTYLTTRMRNEHVDPGLEINSANGRLLAMVRSKWVTDCYGVRMFVDNPAILLAQDIIGLDVPQPWSRAGGVATKLLAHSEVEKHVCEEEKVPSEKITVTGRAHFDRLAKALGPGQGEYKKGIIASLKLKPGLKTVLVNVPMRSKGPKYTRHGTSGMWPWEDYIKELGLMINMCLAIENVQYMLHFHPGCSRDYYKQFLNDRVVDASRYEFVDLLPAVDAVITEHSSIIPFVMGAGLPVISMLYWSLHDSSMGNADFRRLFVSRMCEAGISLVWDSRNLKQVLHESLFSAETKREIERKQSASRDKWVITDGRCAERMALAIKSEIDKKQVI